MSTNIDNPTTLPNIVTHSNVNKAFDYTKSSPAKREQPAILSSNKASNLKIPRTRSIIHPILQGSSNGKSQHHLKSENMPVLADRSLCALESEINSLQLEPSPSSQRPLKLHHPSPSYSFSNSDYRPRLENCHDHYDNCLPRVRPSPTPRPDSASSTHSTVRVSANGGLSISNDEHLGLFTNGKNSHHAPPRFGNSPFSASPLLNTGLGSPEFELYHDSDSDNTQVDVPVGASDAEENDQHSQKIDSLNSNSSNGSSISKSSNDTIDTNSYNMSMLSSIRGIEHIVPGSKNIQEFHGPETRIGGFAPYSNKINAFLQNEKDNLDFVLLPYENSSFGNLNFNDQVVIPSLDYGFNESTSQWRWNAARALEDSEDLNDLNYFVKCRDEKTSNSEQKEADRVSTECIVRELSPGFESKKLDLAVDTKAPLNKASLDDIQEKEDEFDQDGSIIIEHKYPVETLRRKYPPEELIEEQRHQTEPTGTQSPPSSFSDSPLRVPKQRKRHNEILPEVKVKPTPPLGSVSRSRTRSSSVSSATSTSPFSSPSQQLQVRKTRDIKKMTVSPLVSTGSPNGLNKRISPRRDIREMGPLKTTKDPQHTSPVRTCGVNVNTSSPLPIPLLPSTASSLNVSNGMSSDIGGTSRTPVFSNFVSSLRYIDQQNAHLGVSESLGTAFSPAPVSSPFSSTFDLMPTSKHQAPLFKIHSSNEIPQKRRVTRSVARTFAAIPFSPLTENLNFSGNQQPTYSKHHDMTLEDMYEDDADRFNDAEDDEGVNHEGNMERTDVVDGFSATTVEESRDGYSSKHTRSSSPPPPPCFASSPPTPEPILYSQLQRGHRRTTSEDDAEDQPSTPVIRRSKRIKEQEKDPRPRSPGRRCIPRHNSLVPIKPTLKQCESFKDPETRESDAAGSNLPSPSKRAVRGDDKKEVSERVGERINTEEKETEQSKRRKMRFPTPEDAKLDAKYPTQSTSTQSLKEDTRPKRLGFYTPQDLLEFQNGQSPEDALLVQEFEPVSDVIDISSPERSDLHLFQSVSLDDPQPSIHKYPPRRIRQSNRIAAKVAAVLAASSSHKKQKSIENESSTMLTPEAEVLDVSSSPQKQGPTKKHVVWAQQLEW